MEKYSQNNEQGYILSYFSNPSAIKFLEIGAYHPTVFSNTRALIESGCSNGVYVEPAFDNYKEFVSEYPSDKYPNIKLINAAITSYDGVIKFYNSGGDAIGSTSIAHKIKWENGYKVNYTEEDVPCLYMNTLLNDYGKDVDFLNLDVEGTNIELFNLIPDWFWERLKMICIEHDGQAQYIKNCLTKFRFNEIHINGENIILAK